jgi:branched-chain amino acid transport system substrate-binding protein
MVEAYKKKTGYTPSNFAVQAHDAALVVLEAIRAAGSTDPAKVAAALESGKFIAAWGPRQFTALAEGHRMPVDTIISQVQNGKKAVVYPPAAAASQGTSYRPVPPWAWEKK